MIYVIYAKNSQKHINKLYTIWFLMYKYVYIIKFNV